MPINDTGKMADDPNALPIDTVENYVDTESVAIADWELMQDDPYVSIIDTFASDESLHVQRSLDTAVIVQYTNSGRNVTYIKSVHVIGTTAETLFVKEASQQYGNEQGIESIHRTLDGGQTWTRVIRENPGDNLGELYIFEDGANNIRLLSADKYSDDLGDTWTTLTAAANLDFSRSLHVPGGDVYAGMSNSGPYISTNGIDGDFIQYTEGLEAVTIYSVAQLETNLDKVFLGTYSGIALTSVYTDTSVDYADKWKDSNGSFPILSQPYKLVAINPYDENQVWALNGNGMRSSTTGGMTENAWTGNFAFGMAMGGQFSTDITDFDFETFNQEGGEPADIAFYSTDTILVALKCSRSVYGGLIRSNDAGANWHFVTDLPDTCCNTVEIASSGDGTKIIYAGFGAWANDAGGWIMKSDDAGETWSRVDVPQDPSENAPVLIHDILVPSGQTDTMYLAAGKYAAYSFDGGDSITLVTNKDASFNTGMNIGSVALNKNDHDSVYFSQSKYVWVLDMEDVLADSIEPELNLYYTGMPGENIYKLHFDALTMTSSLGFFEISANENNDISRTINGTAKSECKPAIAVPSLLKRPMVPITCTLPRKSSVTVALYNVNGRMVKLLYNGSMPGGTTTVPLYRTGLGSGYYILYFATENTRLCRYIPLLN
ncbi:MAG: hypothetical protein GF350_04650 [Chitinivibrionales bacterium]|nr:hypothetical protein [Chitinivibrionales bacterium]